MYYHLHDTATEEFLGSVRVNNTESIREEGTLDYFNDLIESWEEFNKLEEHDLNPYDVDDFVEWHNENRVSQIERVNFGIIQLEV